jgi:CheY-like chemotaxis protein
LAAAHHTHGTTHHAAMLHLALLGDDRHGDSGYTKDCNGCDGKFCRTFHSVSPRSDCDGFNLGPKCPTGLSGAGLFCIKLSQARELREVCDNLLSANSTGSIRVSIRKHGDDPAAAYSAPHILIVDDDREIRDALMKYLAKNSMRATSAAASMAMDAALKVGQFDLIVLDVMMPGEDGLSVCRRLPAQGGIPILMLTALGREIDHIVGLEVGADDYLPKTFNL